MKRVAWIVFGFAVAFALGVLAVFGAFGAFKSNEDLNQDAADLDTAAQAESVADIAAPGTDGSGEPMVGSHSLPLGGKVSTTLESFTLDDQQGRQVLRIPHMETVVDLEAMQRGVYLVPEGVIEGAHVTLYRDKTGKLSLSHALQESPPPVRRGLGESPGEELVGADASAEDASDDSGGQQAADAQGPWLMHVGPILLRNVTLTLGFTEKPVVFHVDRGTVTIRRHPGDDGPIIHLSDIEGRMVKPDPLPKPVEIAFAEGQVRPDGEPLVSLVARTCIGGDELRMKAIVPARKKAVRLTVDAAGFGGALGKMGLKIASRHKPDKLHYEAGAVALDGGPECAGKDLPTKSDAATAAPSGQAQPPNENENENTATASDETLPAVPPAKHETLREKRHERHPE